LLALASLSDVLTAAMRRGRRDDAAQRQIAAIADLVRHAEHAPEGSSPANDLSTLRGICQHGARAQLVREWGLVAGDSTQTPAPLGDLMRAAAATSAPQRAEWLADDGAAIALAAPTHSPTGQAAVGAIWRRQDLRSGMELALLQVYAQACASIVGRRAG
jgi:hypothetical protein